MFLIVDGALNLHEKTTLPGTILYRRPGFNYSIWGSISELAICSVDGPGKPSGSPANGETAVKVGGRDWNVEFTLDDKVSFTQVEQDLRHYLAESNGWFTGQPVTVNVGARPLTWEELGRLGHVLEEEFSLKVSSFWCGGGPLEVLSAAGGESTLRQRGPLSTPQSTQPEETPLFIKGTCRSGSSADHKGDIVVLGDVNPGAQLKATGDILVFGTVRGIAHAGAGKTGPCGAVIMALSLQPLQLRIGNKVSVTPKSKKSGRRTTAFPEIAFVRGRSIVVTPFTGKFHSVEERNIV